MTNFPQTLSRLPYSNIYNHVGMMVNMGMMVTGITGHEGIATLARLGLGLKFWP